MFCIGICIKVTDSWLYAHYCGPVSYTHLDVYKRQVLDDAEEEVLIEDEDCHIVEHMPIVQIKFLTNGRCVFYVNNFDL